MVVAQPFGTFTQDSWMHVHERHSGVLTTRLPLTMSAALKWLQRMQLCLPGRLLGLAVLLLLWWGGPAVLCGGQTPMQVEHWFAPAAKGYVSACWSWFWSA